MQKITCRTSGRLYLSKHNKWRYIMIYTLDDFVKEYSKICAMGWIKTHRSGPTGIGKHLKIFWALSKTILMDLILVTMSSSLVV